jgi:hypothetical protein
MIIIAIIQYAFLKRAMCQVMLAAHRGKPLQSSADRYINESYDSTWRWVTGKVRILGCSNEWQLSHSWRGLGRFSRSDI